jgi:glycosyltransferase involved in cell wall biosynthesis
MKRSIRLRIQQPALPAYRVPLFSRLANCGFEVQVLFGRLPDIANARPPSGAPWAKYVPLRVVVSICRHELFWHGAQCVAIANSDVAVLNWNLNALSLVPALLIARWNGVRTILWGHGYSRQDSRVRRQLRLASAKLADALLFYTHASADLYKHVVPSSRVFVAENALDQAPIEAARDRLSATERAAFAKANDVDPSCTVLFVSRLLSDNHVNELIDAVAFLRDEFPSLRCVIIGAGEAESVLRSAAAAKRVSDRVRFLGAIYDEDVLAHWFGVATAFCYPANVGLSLLHSFHYGVPVITADDWRLHNPEFSYLEPGVNGLVYRSGDLDALAVALRAILESGSLRDRLAAGAARTAKRLTLESMTEQFVAAVTGVVGLR